MSKLYGLRKVETIKRQTKAAYSCWLQVKVRWRGLILHRL